MASPFPAANPKTEDEVIQPAVQGTRNVLQACADSGCVKRVVLTSSVVAIYSKYRSLLYISILDAAYKFKVALCTMAILIHQCSHRAELESSMGFREMQA